MISENTLTSTLVTVRAIIGRSRFEAALVYKPRILSLKNEEFTFLVHKLSVIYRIVASRSASRLVTPHVTNSSSNMP